MRIAFLPVSAALGGAERVLVEVAAALREQEPRWTLAAFCPAEGPLAERLRAEGVEVQVIALPGALARLGESGRAPLALRALSAGPAAAAYLLRLRAALARFRPEVVHTNGLKMHLLGTLVRPRAARLVWHLHDFLAARRATARLLRMARRGAQGALAVSDAVAADARAALGAAPPLHLVPNRIDLVRFAPTGPVAPLAALAGLPPEPAGTLRVGLVATLGLWKGHETFLRALAALPSELPVRGYVVGGPIYQPTGSQRSLDGLRAMARALGIEGRVGFTGFVAEPADAMRALDVVVHASTQPEPYGLVIAEGMACGRAVIASLAGGAVELVRPEVDALAAPPGDADALAAGIVRLARDPALRERLGRAARERAERGFGRDGLAGELARAYRAAGAA